MSKNAYSRRRDREDALAAVYVVAWKLLIASITIVGLWSIFR